MRATPAVSSDALCMRLLLGAVLLFAYAAWISGPHLYQLYAQIEATRALPSSDAYELVRMSEDSMAPTIPENATAVIDLSSYRQSNPAAGEIVALEVGTRLFIKRVVAVPGDHFVVKDGRVLTNGATPQGWNRAWSPDYRLSVINDTIKIDGLPLDRSIARVPLPSWWGDPATLPDDCYFVLGDNVNDSEDSHDFGCVPLSAILGKIVKVF